MDSRFKPEHPEANPRASMIHLVDLLQEYWLPILFEIASGIGNSISLAEATKTRDFRHYVRILVDLDLTLTLYDEIMVEREGFAFGVGVVYERLLGFCGHWSSLLNVQKNSIMVI